MSQVGPTTMMISFECGCIYRSRVRLMFMRIKEEGNYRIADGVISFTRPSGDETKWPYRFEGERLLIEEQPGELYAYERTERRTCE